MSYSYDTQLTPDDEQQFQEWKRKNAPHDSGDDYDLRGAFKRGVTPDPRNGHWPDTFKKPNHPTFSDQSVYADMSAFGDLSVRPGRWEGDKFIPPKSTHPEDDVWEPNDEHLKVAQQMMEHVHREPEFWEWLLSFFKDHTKADKKLIQDDEWATRKSINRELKGNAPPKFSVESGPVQKYEGPVKSREKFPWE